MPVTDLTMSRRGKIVSNTAGYGARPSRPAPIPQLSTEIRLDHSIVAVSNWEISNRFYRDVVGAELIDVGEGRTAYRLNGTQLNVHGPGVDRSDNVARLPVQPGNSDLCFVWPGPVEEAIAHLAAHDVEIETGPVERFGAQGRGLSVYFRDPDGSLLEFISYR
jgi:catechol 2,3-dioxygenase-like lactoylglutathione lyase family enzyme